MCITYLGTQADRQKREKGEGGRKGGKERERGKEELIASFPVELLMD